MAVAAIATTAATAAAPALDAQEQAALPWLRVAAQSFAEATPSAADLDRLLPLLDGARIIGVGESTHGDHEDQAFKAELIKALVRSGRIQVLALECNRAAAEGFDAYVRQGQGDPVSVIRSKSFFRIWKDDEFAGLILWLRAWNQTAAVPVRIVGDDMQDSARDAAVALDFVRGEDPALADRLAAGLGALETPEATKGSLYQWAVATPADAYAKSIAGAAALEQAMDDHAGAWSARPDWVRARRAAMLATRGLELFDLEAGRPNVDVSKLPLEYESRRDRWMAEVLLAALAPNENAALWAHDGHVQNALPTEMAAKGIANEGATLRARLGQAYRAVGFTWSRGAFNAEVVGDLTGASLAARSGMTPVALSNDQTGDLGLVLDKVGPDHFWLDLRAIPQAQSAFAQRPYFFGDSGSVVIPAKWQTDPEDRQPLGLGFDVMVYFRTITPSHLWPAAK
jgi:erythromycin esterase